MPSPPWWFYQDKTTLRLFVLQCTQWNQHQAHHPQTCKLTPSGVHTKSAHLEIALTLILDTFKRNLKTHVFQQLAFTLTRTLSSAFSTYLYIPCSMCACVCVCAWCALRASNCHFCDTSYCTKKKKNYFLNYPPASKSSILALTALSMVSAHRA